MLSKMISIVFLFSQIILASSQSPALLLSTAIRLNKIVVSYPEGVISERDLNICQGKSACNIIHKRFWLPPIIERLCRCPHRNECPWTWSAADNQTIYLNNRSQMKFCSEISGLPACSQKKSAISISTLLQSGDAEKSIKNHTELVNNDRHKRYSEHRNITVSCYCPEPHYWKLKTNSTALTNENNTKTYYCSKLKKCVRSEFCGYVRVDTHSTFYRCSCPKGHLCITKNRTIYQAEEILYVGDSYKAYCLPDRVKS